MKLAGSASQRAKAARQCCQPAEAWGNPAMSRSSCRTAFWAELVADALRISEKLVPKL